MYSINSIGYNGNAGIVIYFEENCDEYYYVGISPSDSMVFIDKLVDGVWSRIALSSIDSYNLETYYSLKVEVYLENVDVWIIKLNDITLITATDEKFVNFGDKYSGYIGIRSSNATFTAKSLFISGEVEFFDDNLWYLSCTNSPTLSPTEPSLSVQTKTSKDFPFGVPIAIGLMIALISYFVYTYRHRNDQKMMNDEIQRRKSSDHVRDSSISKGEDHDDGIMRIPVLLNELESIRKTKENKENNDGVTVIVDDEDDEMIPTNTNGNDYDNEQISSTSPLKENVRQENDDDIDTEKSDKKSDEESEEVMLIASNTNNDDNDDNDDNVDELNKNEVCDTDSNNVTDTYSNED